jgi:hypothetical protein
MSADYVLAKPTLPLMASRQSASVMSTQTPSNAFTPVLLPTIPSASTSVGRKVTETTACGGEPLIFPYPTGAPTEATLAKTTATASAAVSNSTEDDWESEMEALKKVDRWVKLSEENTPAELAERLRDFIEQHPLIIRISFYELLSSLEWKREHLQKLLVIFERLGDLPSLVKETVDHLNEMHDFYANYPECAKLFLVTLKFLSELPTQYIDPIHAFRSSEQQDQQQQQQQQQQPIVIQPPAAAATTGDDPLGKSHRRRGPAKLQTANAQENYYLREYLSVISIKEKYFLMNVVRHLPAFEYNTFLQLIGKLSITEALTSLHGLDAHFPSSRQCQLCKNKRLSRLEFRMRHDQVPTNKLPITGCLSQWEQHTTQWSADDEQMFSFDVATKQIIWDKHYPVQLVEICDKCLMDVHRSLTNRDRNAPVWQLVGEEQKQSLHDLRIREQELTMLIMATAQERQNRRMKEIALEAIRLTRRGLKDEAEQRERHRVEQARLQQWEASQAAKKAMVDKALESDQQWLENDTNMARNELEIRLDYAAMNKQFAFSAKHQRAPTARKHSKSFTLKETNEQGLPLTAQAAHQVMLCVAAFPLIPFV